MMRADLNAVLDRIEEPELLLRQAVREMEEELGRSEQRIACLEAEREQLNARQEALGASIHSSQEELDLCFDAGKDDLARTLVKRKLESSRLQQALKVRSSDLENTLISENERLEENRVRFESMRQKAEILTEDKPATGTFDDPATVGGVTDAEVEVAFLREQKRRGES
jgi:phage shock protein A